MRRVSQVIPKRPFRFAFPMLVSDITGYLLSRVFLREIPDYHFAL